MEFSFERSPRKYTKKTKRKGGGKKTKYSFSTKKKGKYSLHVRIKIQIREKNWWSTLCRTATCMANSHSITLKNIGFFYFLESHSQLIRLRD